LNQRHYHSEGRDETALGIDVGATLAKLADRVGDARPRFRLLPAEALDEIAAEVNALVPDRIGLTGGGAAELAERLPREATRVAEFEAWGSGASALLPAIGLATDQPYLLVSLGTGTSILLVDREGVRRIGGTALGGGTVVGLGAAVLDVPRFQDLVSLAAKGSHGTVDLLVSDIYRVGERPLPGDLTAASFGKLAWRTESQRPTPGDLAHAVMRLVGENVALLCGSLAAAAGVSTVVFAGSTLRANPMLVEILCQVAGAFGCQPMHLPDGEFAGALGALLLSTSPGDSEPAR
jgi:type II pantothenate kinase